MTMVRKDKDPAGWKPVVGEKVICGHNGVPYEAKVLNVGKDPKDTGKTAETKYLIHYQGWNKNWDEWVELERIQEFNDVNIKNMHESRKKVRNQGKGPGSGKKKSASIQQNQSMTSSVNSSLESISEPMIIEPEEPIQLDKEVKIRIPDELKNWLIDDDNNIKNKKLTILPARVPVNIILKDFINHKKNTNRLSNETVLNELTLGIKDYFSVMLGSHLLYKFERLQYQNLLKEHGREVDLAAQYGVIHLVRMFIKVGKILAHSTLEPQNVTIIVNYMQDLLKFISKQAGLFDLEKNYTVAPPEYIKNALK